MTQSEEIKQITSFQQLNELVAESLGWHKTGWRYELEYYSGNEIQVYYWCPPDVTDENEMDNFYDSYGIIPDFSNSRYDIDWILNECDRLGLFIQCVRNKDLIGCTIFSKEGFHSVSTDSVDNLPRSMELATCLAWLKYKGIQVNLQLESEGI